MASERLRVLFLTHWYPTREQPIGGIFVREHARAVQRYDDVRVLHCAGPRRDVSGVWRLEEEREPALTEHIPTYRVWHRPSPLPGLTTFLYLWAVLRAAAHLRRQGFRPDILHAHIYEAGVAAVLLGRWWRVPVVITEHSSDFPRRRLPRWQVWKARFAFAGAARVLPVSLALQQGIEQYGVRARFVIVPNVVDPSLFYPSIHPRPRAEVKRLLFVGSLLPIKGVPTLLEALAQLRQQRQDWQIDLVGDGAQRTEYEALAVALNLTDHVRFHGRKSKTEVAEFMHRADLFILPSLWENAPCVISEALASGLPVAASQVGGIPEMITPETGRLTPPGDPVALALTLDAMLDGLPGYDPALILAHAQRYNLATVGRSLHQLYLRCLNR